MSDDEPDLIVPRLAARIAELEHEVARLRAGETGTRRRRGRPRDPARLAKGERIHQWRQKGVIWYGVARRLGQSIRAVQLIYRDWKTAQVIVPCAVAPVPAKEAAPTMHQNRPRSAAA